MLSTPMSRSSRMLIALLLTAGGVALLVWQIGSVGFAEVRDGLRSVGWGFLGVLVLSGLRFVMRAMAWRVLLGEAVSLRRAVGAVIAGDALGNVTVLSLVVSEPAKAMYLGPPGGAARALAALTAENFFYTVSIAVYVMLGTGAMLYAFALPPEVVLAGQVALGLFALLLAAAAWLAWQQPKVIASALDRLHIPRLRAVVERIRQFEIDMYGAVGRQRARLGVVAGFETTFHLLSFLESWLTLWLLTGESLLLAAFVLDTFNRVSNVVFKMIPFRLGVDQFGSSFVAEAIGRSAADGLNLSIVRFGRLLIWAMVGLVLLAGRGIRRPPGS
jgi:hypothetical protein